jgi:hypothetical protein
MADFIKGRLACDYGEEPSRFERSKWRWEACPLCGEVKSRGAAVCKGCGLVAKHATAEGRARQCMIKFLRGWKRHEGERVVWRKVSQLG